MWNDQQSLTPMTVMKTTIDSVLREDDEAARVVVGAKSHLTEGAACKDETRNSLILRENGAFTPNEHLEDEEQEVKFTRFFFLFPFLTSVI